MTLAPGLVVDDAPDLCVPNPAGAECRFAALGEGERTDLTLRALTTAGVPFTGGAPTLVMTKVAVENGPWPDSDPSDNTSDVSTRINRPPVANAGPDQVIELVRHRHGYQAGRRRGHDRPSHSPYGKPQPSRRVRRKRWKRGLRLERSARGCRQPTAVRSRWGPARGVFVAGWERPAGDHEPAQVLHGHGGRELVEAVMARPGRRRGTARGATAAWSGRSRSTVDGRSDPCQAALAERLPVQGPAPDQPRVAAVAAAFLPPGAAFAKEPAVSAAGVRPPNVGAAGAAMAVSATTPNWSSRCSVRWSRRSAPVLPTWARTAGDRGATGGCGSGVVMHAGTARPPADVRQRMCIKGGSATLRRRS